MDEKYKAQYKYRKEKIARIYIDVRKETKEKFQEIAAKNNTKPSTLLRQFVENYIKEEK